MTENKNLSSLNLENETTTNLDGEYPRPENYNRIMSRLYLISTLFMVVTIIDSLFQYGEFGAWQILADAGDVVISETAPTKVENFQTGCKEPFTSPVRLQHKSLFINAHHFNTSTLNIVLYDITGRVVTRESVPGNQDGEVSLSIGQFSTSAFIAHVSGGGKSWSGMLVSTK